MKMETGPIFMDGKSDTLQDVSSTQIDIRFNTANQILWQVIL